MTDRFEVSVKIDPKAVERLKFESSEALLRTLAIIGESEAKSNAPVDTGTLRRSITHEVNTERNNVFARIGTNIRYAVFQELGTRFHPAHPFLRPILPVLQRFLKRGSL